MTQTLERYCTFSVGEMLVGVDVRRVREVVSDQQLTPVPLAPASVAGVLNLRGEIMTGIDARQRLGLGERAAGEVGRVHVIVTTDGEAVSLLVDEERDVVELDPATAQSVPDTVRAEVRSVLNAVHALEGGMLLLVLDPDLAVSVID